MSNTSQPYFGHAKWQLLPLDCVSLTGGFWADWQEVNRRTTLQHGYEMLEKAGNLNNLRIAAGQIEGQYRGMVFQDSDVYKWLEAVGYELMIRPDTALQQQADAVIDLIAAAQAEDGYLNSYYQTVEPDARWTDLDFGHELYCAGHLFQAAIAYTRATHTTKLLGIATRFADMIAATFNPEGREGAPGHPEIETALVELYRETGNKTYLDLAQYFIDQRGKNIMRGVGWMKAEYHQDRVPVRQSDRVEGHAVRAMYLNAGVTDVYLETGEPALLDAMHRGWRDMVSGKMFLTGGLGSRYEGEAFGDPYELPSDQCYCETCASIGGVMWNLRMLQVTGDARYADVSERMLYNGVLSGLALDGRHFFYMNPLLSRGGYARAEWQRVACCPPNLMRLLASLGQYIATRDENGVQVHLYNSADISAELTPGRMARLSMQTDYPWQGDITLKIGETDGAPWQLRLRQPEWVANATVAVNGQPVEASAVENGYIVLERAWQPGDVIELSLPMEPTLVEPHPRIDSVRDSLAIQRGPLVYCIEAADHPQANLMDIRLDETMPLTATTRDDLVPATLVAVQASGYVEDENGWRERLYRPAREDGDAPRRPVKIMAIPYYAWANRGANAMRVWIPRAR